MRFVAAIGLAALAVGCAPKLDLVDSNSDARQAATRLAQGTDETAAAASAAQAAKPAIRNARPSSLRAQAADAHDQGNTDSQNNLAVPALRGPPAMAAPVVTAAPPGTAQRDAAVAPQAARVGAGDRVPGQARDQAQEKALSPARETAPVPARETVFSPAREAALSPAREASLSPARDAVLSPARGAALSPAREAASNEGILQASTCIRSNIKAAYRSSDTVDEATAFLMKTCFAPFALAIASDEASAKTLFRGLVFQEISPVEWLQALQEGAAQSR
jgi:hypothetical protein